MKINNGCRNIVIEGNLFYNQQGSDEHIDINGVENVTVQDNVFFNDFAGSGRANANDTSGYIVIKNSAALPVNRGFIVRRNVFLNWEGSDQLEQRRDQPLSLGPNAAGRHPGPRARRPA